MIAYEFYWRDPIKGPQLIGILPERRKKPERISHDSIINWGKTLLGENVDINDIFFVKIRMDNRPEKIFNGVMKGIPFDR